MKNTSKTTKTAAPSPDPEASAGPGGISLAPPAYGIESLDHTSGLTLQAKLSVTSASDATEKEADQIAERVMGQIRQPQNKPFQPSVSKQPNPAAISPKLQAPIGFAGGDVPGQMAASIKQAKGGGSALDKPVRSKMDHAFEADFSGVRVHADQDSDSLNRDLQANAFTTGQDIFFRQGQYDPGSQAGQRLIAHELTHVIQQGGREYGTVNRAVAQNVIQRDIVIYTEHPNNRKKKTDKNKWAKKTYKTIEAVKKSLISEALGMIDEDKFPGLNDELQRLLNLETEASTFDSNEEFVQHLRARLWNPLLETIFATQPEEEDPLVTGMKKLQTAGLSYAKPGVVRILQTDFWKGGDVNPHMLNCWQTVLFAAYKQGLIDHKTFIKAESQIGGFLGPNVLAEAIYQAAGEDKIEWKEGEPESALQELREKNIPAGYVIVFGRKGQHVGVSMGKDNAGKHKWIENDTTNILGDQDRPLSDIKISYLEETINSYASLASAVYWAPLPTSYKKYVSAQTSAKEEMEREKTELAEKEKKQQEEVDKKLEQKKQLSASVNET